MSGKNEASASKNQRKEVKTMLNKPYSLSFPRPLGYPFKSSIERCPSSNVADFSLHYNFATFIK